jgi:L-lactate dehydrogenase complex protein LldG
MADLFPPDVRGRLAAAGSPVPHPGRPAPATAVPVDEAVATFAEACEAVGGRVSRLARAEDVAALVAMYLEDPAWAIEGSRPAFVAWPDEHLPAAGLTGLLRAHGAECLETSVSDEPEARASDLQRLDRAIVGITGADAALVDTGSVVLVHGEGRGRLVSLLPPVHVAVVGVERLQPSFGAWLAAQPERVTASANLVVVTGPSRTADIEMTLTRGVHGPRIVHVVFLG